jgi:hypothetical protein
MKPSLRWFFLKHNDVTWCPQSEPFENWGPRLKHSHPLPLLTKLSLKDVKKLYTKMKGVFNKMINNYKRSGNRDLNIQDLVSHGGDTKSKSKGNNENDFTDNSDKQNFCFKTTHYSYFWALAERNQFTTTVSQNCNSIGLSSAETTEILMTSTSTSSSPSKKKQKKMNIENKTNEMISVVKGMREEMNTVSKDRAILLLQIELRETNQQHNKL